MQSPSSRKKPLGPQVHWILQLLTKVKSQNLCRPTMKVVRHWHRLPREAVDAPFLAVFKAKLDGALNNLL